MDPLSDVLSLLRPRSHVTADLDAGGDWAIRFDAGDGWIKCYAVTRGACWLAVDGVAEPVRLSAGDCFVLASGRPFTLASDLALTPVTPREVFEEGARRGGGVTWQGGGVAMTGSRFTVEGRHAGALGTLPPIIHLDERDDQAALCWSIERMTAELSEDRPGAAAMAEHLSYLMLLQALRLHLARGGARSASWFSALADPPMGPGDRGDALRPRALLDPRGCYGLLRTRQPCGAAGR